MFSTVTKTAANLAESSAEHDIKSNLRDSAKVAEKKAKALYDEAAHYAEDAGNKIRILADDARADIKSVADRATTQVRANPLPSALAMLGVGLVLGLLLRGPRHAH